MREINAAPGPRFFVENGETMFAFRVDAGTEIGPRKATKADAEKHPDAFKGFMLKIAPTTVEPEPVMASEDEAPIPFTPKKRGRPPKARED